MYHSCRHVVIGGDLSITAVDKIPELRSLVDQTVDHPCHRQLSRTIRVPVHVTESLRMIRKAQLDASTGSEATSRDISRLTELPLEKVQKLLNIPEDPVLLDTGRGANGSRTNRRFAAQRPFAPHTQTFGVSGCR